MKFYDLSGNQILLLGCGLASGKAGFNHFCSDLNDFNELLLTYFFEKSWHESYLSR
jgi:hypothetical protein